MPPKTASGDKTFSADTIKGLLASLLKRGVTVGNADFQVMAKLDANVTASALEHQFRALKKQAAEIAKTLDGDVAPAKTSKTPKSTTGTAKKRGAKAVEATQEDDDAEDSPSKKKAKKEKVVKKEKLPTPESDAQEGDVQEPVVEDGSNTNVLGTSFFEDALPVA